MCQFQHANFENISCQNWKLLIACQQYVECFLWALKKATSVNNIDLVLINFYLLFLFFFGKFIFSRKFTEWFSAAWGESIPYDGLCRNETIL